MPRPYLARRERVRLQPQLAAWGLAAIFAIAVCYSLVRIPLQVTDSLIPILDAHDRGSVSEAVVASVSSSSYLRPLRIGQIELLFQLSGGRYFLVYKAFHVALVIALFALVILALDVGTRGELLVLAFALTVLTGIHTFLGTVWEAFPINHFLEIAVLCLLAFVLARSRGGWWIDVGAVLVFVVASLTLESGLLVWVVIVAGWLVGLRGISTRGVVAVSGLLAGYFLLRWYLGTGSPDLLERASGFGMERLEPEELVRRFGERPYVFYAYNVVSSFLSVLFAQPRDGVWTIPLEWSARRVSIGTALNVASSLITTLVIAWFVIRRVRRWSVERLDSADQLVLVSLAVIAANAAISYGYTKDVVMSPAGVFYSLAAFAALREAIASAGRRGLSWRSAAMLALVLAIAAGGWGARAVGLHYHMHKIAMDVRTEWVHVETWLKGQNEWPSDPEAVRIVRTLREDAIERDVTNLRLARWWMPELFR